MNRIPMIINGQDGLRGALGLTLLVLFALVGCGGGNGPAIQTEMIPFTPDQTRALESARSAEYRIRPGDRLGVDFKYEDELDSSNLLVLPDGNLTLPGGVDPVNVRGLTVMELDSALTAEYELDYMEPELSVIMENLADLHVYVFGHVSSPGQVRLPQGSMGVLQAIASAGGFKDGASPSETALMRVTEEGFLLRRIDLSHLEKRGIPGLAALDLQPYDVIYGPRGTLGDMKYFSDTFLGTTLDVSQLFWDIYAIGQIDKVTTLYR